MSQLAYGPELCINCAKFCGCSISPPIQILYTIAILSMLFVPYSAFHVLQHAMCVCVCVQVLNHWRFSEIKDCNYSGYSFTLVSAVCGVGVCVCVTDNFILFSLPQQLKTEADYFVRTDDGEAICLYIEAFQKDPEAALVSNPT